MTKCNIPDKSEGTHSHRLQFRIPRNQVSTNILIDAAEAPIVNVAEQGIANRLVISKVVPKIWARTNSAIMEGGGMQVDKQERERFRREFQVKEDERERRLGLSKENC